MNQGVFADLKEKNPDGFGYASFCLDDGVTFIHIAVSENGANPLSESAAFEAFKKEITDRQVPGTRVASSATVVGSYNFQTYSA